MILCKIHHILGGGVVVLYSTTEEKYFHLLTPLNKTSIMDIVVLLRGQLLVHPFLVLGNFCFPTDESQDC